MPGSFLPQSVLHEAVVGLFSYYCLQPEYPVVSISVYRGRLDKRHSIYLDVFEETVLEELVIFDSKSGELYPIGEMDMEIDGHIIEICLDEQWNYTIKVNG